MITDSPGVDQHDRRRGAGGIRRAGDGDAAIGLLERRGVVHPVAGHAHDVTVLLQHVDNVEFVLREDLGETIGVLDGFGYRRGFLGLGITKHAAIENVRAHPQGLGGLLGDRQGIAR